MKLIGALVVLMTATSLAGSAQADSVNYEHFDQAGFGDVGQLLQNMTPQQRAEVMKQAALKEKDLQKLTPQQLEQLKKQLRDIADSVKINQIDPKKVDVSKAKTTGTTQKDLNAYQKRQEQVKSDDNAVTIKVTR